jgi:hypothetical protein
VARTARRSALAANEDRAGRDADDVFAEHAGHCDAIVGFLKGMVAPVMREVSNPALAGEYDA